MIYVTSKEEMEALFSYLPEAISNTALCLNAVM
jgi:DNA polymerase III alpha subunit